MRPLKSLTWLSLLATFIWVSCSSLPTGTSQVSTPSMRTSPVATATMDRTKAALFASATPEPAPPDELGDLEGVTITLWHPFTGSLADALSRLAREFSRENAWGIQGQAVSFGGDLALSDALSAASPEESPQLLLALTSLVNGWGDTGRVVFLDDYLEMTGVGLDDPKVDQFNPIFWQQSRLNDHQLGIPALRTGYVLVYNRGWAKELGFPSPPVTPAQFKEQACAAAKVNNRSPYLEMRGTGGWLVDTSANTVLSWLYAFGTSGVPDDPGQAYQFNQPEAKAALEFLRGMQADGCLWIGRYVSPFEYFPGRYALFYSTSLQSLEKQRYMMADQESQDEWTILPYPSTTGKPFLLADGYDLGIVKSDAREQLAAWLFLRWLVEPQNQAQLAALYPSLPVSSAWHDLTADYRTGDPWRMILPLESAVRAAPSLPNWLVARRPLEDAAWQLFNLASAEQIDEILPQLDAMIAALLRNP